MLWILAIIAATWENMYFGWNDFPKSDAELIADLICILLLGLAVFCHQVKK